MYDACCRLICPFVTSAAAGGCEVTQDMHGLVELHVCTNAAAVLLLLLLLLDRRQPHRQGPGTGSQRH